MKSQPSSKPGRKLSKKTILGIVGGIIGSCCLCIGIAGALDSLGLLPTRTSTPTQALKANGISTIIAQTSVSALTQTAAALPSPTFVFGASPLPIESPALTATTLPTNTSMPTTTQLVFITSTLAPDCLAAYPDFCISGNPRLTCTDLPKNFKVLPPDPLGYDKDGDGVGCEN